MKTDMSVTYIVTDFFVKKIDTLTRKYGYRDMNNPQRND